MTKVAALTLMKNEADILPFKLKFMEDQVDYYLFLDNDSDDNSLEIVSAHPKTVFCDIIKETYRTTLRDILIEKAQEFIGNEDWMVYIDPDEVPFFNIKDTIQKISSEYNCALIHRPFFFFTKEMFIKWNEDKEYREKILNFDIRNYNYFANTDHGEIRMVKNSKINGERLKLTQLKMAIPRPDPAIIFDGELYFGHYQYRNPEQMKIRLETRKDAIERGSPSFHYYTKKWGIEDWDYKKLFVPQKKLIRYDYDKPFTMKNLKLKKMNKLFFRLFNPNKLLLYYAKYLFRK
ncbi:MAG: glycosyltransferase family 2 protein [Candidatus Jordarchaeum sp.]|uniref:glycosyltransferase family 2 protein n=1 Tax=Candidatus Jordarchaeum sp. TaxID=2823881 RepID=UPI00404BA100